MDRDFPLPRQTSLKRIGRPTLGALLRVFAAILAIWAGVWAGLTWALYLQAGRLGHPRPFLALAVNTSPPLPFLILFSFTVHVILELRPGFLFSARKGLYLLLASTLVFFVPAICCDLLMGLHIQHKPLGQFFPELLRYPIYLLTMNVLLFLGTFATLYGIAFFNRGLDSERSKRQAEAENLELRYALEHERLQALQAQLEPHFMFNALNAISSLVRGEDRQLTLKALSGLSGLLRYALTATKREWVSLEEELAFIEEYLALQRLRFGDRLEVVITGRDAVMEGADCPPLLLQPLVENAIRHGLESHEGEARLELRFQVEGPRLQIRLTNPIHPGSSPNPGLGLGLTSVRDRLTRLYPGSATFEAGGKDGVFTVDLSLPLIAHD